MSLQYDDIKEVELIVRGEVQGVGYRQYVAKIGRKLKLAGFVENLKDGTVRIRCKGMENAVLEFKRQINVKNPEGAPLIEVEDIEETQLAQGTIKKKFFEEKYSDLKAEMSQGFSTGMGYMNLLREETQLNLNRFREETQSNLNLFREETQTSFKHMDQKYDKISQAMFAVVNGIEERNKTFESRMEKTDTSIESLLKILAQKKT